MHKYLANSLFIGKPIVNVPICHSTNDKLAEMLQNDPLAEGTVIITPNQTSGRGQRGNSWESEPGKNLTFSILLKPRFLPVQDQFALHYLTSLAIIDALEGATELDFKVKWPNDIYLSNRKLGGILIENNLKGKFIDTSIIGIGLNINQHSFSEEKAVSLRMLAGNDLNLEELLESVLLSFEKQYLLIRSGNLESLKNRYLEKLYWKDERHQFSSKDGKRFEGIIVGINETGRLMVQCNGHVDAYDFKEIEFIG